MGKTATVLQGFVLAVKAKKKTGKVVTEGDLFLFIRRGVSKEVRKGEPIFFAH